MPTIHCSVLMLAVLAAPAAPADSTPKALPFIENDYGAALAQARARGVPVFVDVWAPW